eukprot:scaffold207_cov267-Pinguiococcus_pyrenoidosus.AAC.29
MLQGLHELQKVLAEKHVVEAVQLRHRILAHDGIRVSDIQKLDGVRFLAFRVRCPVREHAPRLVDGRRVAPVDALQELGQQVGVFGALGSAVPEHGALLLGERVQRIQRLHLLDDGLELRGVRDHLLVVQRQPRGPVLLVPLARQKPLVFAPLDGEIVQHVRRARATVDVEVELVEADVQDAAAAAPVREILPEGTGRDVQVAREGILALAKVRVALQLKLVVRPELQGLGAIHNAPFHVHQRDAHACDGQMAAILADAEDHESDARVRVHVGQDVVGDVDARSREAGRLAHRHGLRPGRVHVQVHGPVIDVHVRHVSPRARRHQAAVEVQADLHVDLLAVGVQGAVREAVDLHADRPLDGLLLDVVAAGVRLRRAALAERARAVAADATADAEAADIVVEVPADRRADGIGRAGLQNRPQADDVRPHHVPLILDEVVAFRGLPACHVRQRILLGLVHDGRHLHQLVLGQLDHLEDHGRDARPGALHDVVEAAQLEVLVDEVVGLPDHLEDVGMAVSLQGVARLLLVLLEGHLDDLAHRRVQGRREEHGRAAEGGGCGRIQDRRARRLQGEEHPHLDEAAGADGPPEGVKVLHQVKVGRVPEPHGFRVRLGDPGPLHPLGQPFVHHLELPAAREVHVGQVEARELASLPLLDRLRLLLVLRGQQLGHAGRGRVPPRPGHLRQLVPLVVRQAAVRVDLHDPGRHRRRGALRGRLRAERNLLVGFRRPNAPLREQPAPSLRLLGQGAEPLSFRVQDASSPRARGGVRERPARLSGHGLEEVALRAVVHADPELRRVVQHAEHAAHRLGVLALVQGLQRRRRRVVLHIVRRIRLRRRRALEHLGLGSPLLRGQDASRPEHGVCAGSALRSALRAPVARRCQVADTRRLVRAVLGSPTDRTGHASIWSVECADSGKSASSESELLHLLEKQQLRMGCRLCASQLGSVPSEQREGDWVTHVFLARSGS